MLTGSAKVDSDVRDSCLTNVVSEAYRRVSRWRYQVNSSSLPAKSQIFWFALLLDVRVTGTDSQSDWQVDSQTDALTIRWLFRK